MIKNCFLTIMELNWKYCFGKAFLMLKLKHRNTKLGLWWEPIILLIVTLVLSIVWSQIFSAKVFEEFFIYILVGFGVWGFISGVVMKATTIFVRNANILRDSGDQILEVVIIDVIYECLAYISKSPIIIFCVLILADLNLVGVLLHIYGLILIAISGFGLSLTLGVLTAYYLDLSQLMQAIIRLSFLITPIIWPLERLGEYATYIVLNPFYNYVEITRSGLMGNIVDGRSIVIATLLSLLIMLIGVIVHKKYKTSLMIRVHQL